MNVLWRLKRTGHLQKCGVRVSGKALETEQSTDEGD